MPDLPARFPTRGAEEIAGKTIADEHFLFGTHRGKKSKNQFHVLQLFFGMIKKIKSNE